MDLKYSFNTHKEKEIIKIKDLSEETRKAENPIGDFFPPIYLSHLYECMLSYFSRVLLFITLWALAR